MRDDRQGQEGHLQEGFGQDAVERPGSVAQMMQVMGDLFEAFQTHEPGNGQGEFGRHPAAIGDRKAAAQLDQAIDRRGHVRVIGADHGDVVAVMPHRGGDGAALETEAGNEAAADIAVLAVALDDGDLDDVRVEVGLQTLFGMRQARLLAEGENKAGPDADDRHPVLPGFWLGNEGFGGHRLCLHRCQAHRCHHFACGKEFGRDQSSPGDDVGDAAILETVEDGDVGAPTGRHEAAVPQAKDARGRVAGGAIDMVQGTAHGDQPSDGAIQMPFLGDVQRIAVVGA